MLGRLHRASLAVRVGSLGLTVAVDTGSVVVQATPYDWRMQLDAMWIWGHRRFGGPKPHKLRLDTRLVCIIGANEVGKSTLLDALEYPAAPPDAETGEFPEIDRLDRTRGEDVADDQEIVRLRYRLGDTEHAVLAGLPSAAQLKNVRWLERTKRADGDAGIGILPTPQRATHLRDELAAAVSRILTRPKWPSEIEVEDTPVDEPQLRPILAELESGRSTLGPAALASLDELAAWLEENDLLPKVAVLARAVAEAERRPHPVTEAREALKPLIPRFVRFDEAERNIADEYDLAAVIDTLPPPLANLANLARLDLRSLLSKIQLGETGTVADMIADANEELRLRFESWTQVPPVTVSIDTSGTRLFVHVKSGSGASMRIRERSEGLRQFVALVALTAQQGHRVPPILLIDEVEMHLHYDAQADLITVLAEQEASAQVIYTTHSAACLPEDLGSAVRVVEGIGDKMASTVRQQFWSDEPGLGALLMAMGAGSLAFVPLRPAVIVEGGGDLVLLPSLIREAAGLDMLGFQTVPGAAIVPPKRVAGLDLHGVATVWVLDGDDSGLARRKYLEEQGVPRRRILLLQSSREPLELEDLVHPEVYITAVNAYAEDVGASERFTMSELPSETCHRHEALMTWFARNNLAPPSKIAIANKVLECRGEMPLVEPRRRASLKKLHRQVSELLELE